MAKPAKYTERRIARFDKATDKLLVRRAKTMGIAPAVVIRIIVEHSVKGEPIKIATQNPDAGKLIFEALGASSALFMSKDIKGTEIVMPDRELTKIGNKLLADLAGLK